MENGLSGLRERASRPATSAPGRRRGVYAVAGGLVAVVIAAIALVGGLGGTTGAGPAPSAGSAGTAGQYPTATGAYRLPAGALSLVAGVPVSALIANAQAQRGRGEVAAPMKLPPAAPELSSDGHPEIMFMCAEYWADCAAERWALVMALSKFGTFTALEATTSSSTGTSPRIPTFTFYGAAYSSAYLTLVTDELETNTDVGGGEYPLLQPPTAQEMSMLGAWDRAPYTSVKASLPFAYMGGKFLLTATQYNARAISGANFQDAARVMASGTAAVSKDAQAAAGYLVADFCVLTRDQPAQVCSQVPPGLLGITAPPTGSTP